MVQRHQVSGQSTIIQLILRIKHQEDQIKSINKKIKIIILLKIFLIYTVDEIKTIKFDRCLFLALFILSKNHQNNHPIVVSIGQCWIADYFVFKISSYVPVILPQIVS